MKVLIFDIETSCPSGKPDPKTDSFRFVGAYSYITKRYYFLSLHQKKEIIELFKQHKFIIGFYSNNYDIPILKRDEYLTGYNFSLDLREIIKKRAGLLGCKYQSFSLKNLAKFFKISHKQEDFDYSILNPTGWTDEELKLIEKYTMQDIKVTKEMFEHVFKFFEPLKEYMNDYDRKTFKWLTASIASYTYKVICNLTGINEEYNDNIERKTYDGGYVKEPSGEHFDGNIYYMDFSSLYPSIMVQGNLFSWRCNCCKEEEKWIGNNFFDLNGKYCSKKRGKVETVILDLYRKRQEYKKVGDKREYTIKIILNTLYGLTGNPVFKYLYHYDTACDCTAIGRTITKYSIKFYEDNGYDVIYSDTDSCFVKDNFNDKVKLLNVKDQLIKEIKSHLPLPADMFDMKIDAELRHIWFFKTGEHYNKKQYIYVNKNNKVKVVGLPMIKCDGSKIGYKIFNKYMKGYFLHGKSKFKYNQVQEWALKELSENMMIGARVIRTFKFKDYKLDSQFQAQVSAVYGAGIHTLIPNTQYGVGKGKIKYCTKDEFEAQGLNINAIDLSKMWAELKPFIEDYPEIIRKKIQDKVKTIQKGLFEWSNVE